MLTVARDLMAVLFLERRLARLREAQIERMLAGEEPGPDFIERGERAIVEDMKARFFNPSVRQIVDGPESVERTDDQDFDRRDQRLAERAVIMAHRRLLQIPCVGQPGFEAE